MSKKNQKPLASYGFNTQEGRKRVAKKSKEKKKDFTALIANGVTLAALIAYGVSLDQDYQSDKTRAFIMDNDQARIENQVDIDFDDLGLGVDSADKGRGK